MGEAIDDAAELGVPDDDDDVEQANVTLAVLGDAAAAVEEAVLPDLHDSEYVKRRIEEARFEGKLRYHSEEVPKMRAAFITSAIKGGVLLGVGGLTWATAGSKVFTAVALLNAIRAILQSVFK